MYTTTETVRHGEYCGPVDWDHETAAGKPEIWREAEANPEAFMFIANGGFKAREIFKIGMYDGWPYWKPTPAMLVDSPFNGCEWVFFNSYGVTDRSVFRKETD